jgi:hypothetical protein
MASNVVDASQAISTDQTTTFASDAVAVSSTIIKPLSIDSALRSSSTIFNSQDIKNFLGKPVVCQSGVLSTTDAYATFPAINVPSGVFTSAMSTNKLDGFLGYRATFKFRIVFNATRFQMGRYMLTWVPSGGAPTNTGQFPLTYPTYTNTLVQRSQLQRVEFDLSCDTEAILEIPYVSTLNFIPLIGRTGPEAVGDLGRLRLYPYEKLTVDSGTPTVAYTIYVSLHDIELVGAAVPQSGVKSRVTKRGNPSEEEQNSVKVGPVQSMMKIGLDVSSALTAVPLLSNFATPASWIFDALHGTAAMFGWSKPSDLAPVGRMIQTYAGYLGSSDNADCSLPLSMSVKNAVDPGLGFSGTDIDELDFKHFATIPAWIATNTWSTSDARGTQLGNFDLSPVSFSVSRPAQLPGVIDYTPLAFAASYFKYWRGSLVFKIKIVRTEFHSGRLSFAYFPTEISSTAATVQSFANAHYVNRHIVDIRESNEVTITIPYINSAPWLDTNERQIPGNFSIYVEDKLVAPATVPQNIRLIIEVAGGPDMEFAYPVNAFLNPGLRAVPQSGKKGENPENVCAIVNATIGGTTTNENDIINSALCIGEKISSFRTLVKHFNSLPNNTSPIFGSFSAFVPFGAPWWTIDIAAPTAPSYFCDLYGTLSSIFLFSRGGVRWKAVPLNTGTVDLNVRQRIIYHQPLQSTSPTVTTMVTNSATVDFAGNAPSVAPYSNGPKVIARMADLQPIEVTVPQYHRWHSRINIAHITDALPYQTAKPNYTTPILIQIAPIGAVAFGTTKFAWFRAGADDTNFGVFISIPPMVKFTVNAL